MLSFVLYGLLATTGSNAAEIRRRQELALAAPRVIVQAQGQLPQMQKPPMPSAGLPSPQGTYYTRPPGPIPSAPIPSNGPVPPIPNQNLVIPGPQPGAQPGPGSATTSDAEAPGDNSSGDDDPLIGSDGTVLPGGTKKDDTNTPFALLGPKDTPGPNSWAEVLPNLNLGSDDHTPENTAGGPVTAAVESSTNTAAGILTDDQKQDLLDHISPEEFEQSTPDFQELVLVAAQDKLMDSEAKIEDVAEPGSDPEPVTSLTQETYTEIQDIGQNLTGTSADLSQAIRGLIGISLDELRNNATSDVPGPGMTDANGNSGSQLKKRWVSAVLGALGALIEISKLADKVLDEGISLWKKIKAARG
ncbi:hypothetical protein AOL_s00004g312 [Orbilia oligospora ATCC 24927]|uniref:Uncharacterized protein n=1 Tax=Arthrobotrys oligospora (strain ATCC 24927 / CBS 115.81 / DSM 1491) TaxID=756982 RepID=G1WYF2_ARTOA|nr:hypothetical protein AOL_s00004g312 [Orbilia oligospora ATCC 24927]EGX54279.1 hypothetical protein AOL_s00004g312 [Orbilia oligospora ATCC 24927]